MEYSNQDSFDQLYYQGLIKSCISFHLPLIHRYLLHLLLKLTFYIIVRMFSQLIPHLDLGPRQILLHCGLLLVHSVYISDQHLRVLYSYFYSSHHFLSTMYQWNFFDDGRISRCQDYKQSQHRLKYQEYQELTNHVFSQLKDLHIYQCKEA